MPAHLSEADDLLARSLSEMLCAAHRDWRMGLPRGSAFITPAIPDALIDRDAPTTVGPLLGRVVAAAIAAQADPAGATWAKYLAHATERPSITTDLRNGAA